MRGGHRGKGTTGHTEGSKPSRCQGESGPQGGHSCGSGRVQGPGVQPEYRLRVRGKCWAVGSKDWLHRPCSYPSHLCTVPAAQGSEFGTGDLITLSSPTTPASQLTERKMDTKPSQPTSRPNTSALRGSAHEKTSWATQSLCLVNLRIWEKLGHSGICAEAKNISQGLVNILISHDQTRHPRTMTERFRVPTQHHSSLAPMIKRLHCFKQRKQRKKDLFLTH